MRELRSIPLVILMALLFVSSSRSQEINARVNVVAGQIGTAVDKKVFQTLQTALMDFVNKRKWTSDVFAANERISCSFLINLQQSVETGVYKATMTVQSARPVYNSSYLSPLINFQDNDFTFRYVEFQPLEFNENRVSGTEPLAANLTAVIAFYVNLIIGLDYDSFSPKGGDPYFVKAMAIVNAAPEGRNISGWKAFDGQRNRYWLMENLTNSRYSLIHDAYYSFYRLAMDKMYENETEARQQLFNCLNMLNTLHTENPNIMIIPFFFQGKSDEIINVFRKAPVQDRVRAAEILQKLDITNASKYKQELR
jgi:hypothetical protein